MFQRPCNDKMKRNYFVRRKTNVSFELNTSLTSPHVSRISNREFRYFLQQKQDSFSSAEKLGKIGIQDWQFVKTCGEQQSVSLKIRNPGCGFREMYCLATKYGQYCLVDCEVYCFLDLAKNQRILKKFLHLLCE